MELPIITNPCPVEERETTIYFHRYDDTAEVFTSDSTIVTKLNKMVEKYPDVYLCRTSSTGDGVFYEFPKKLVSFRAPPSEAQIAAGKRLTEARKQGGSIDDENA